MVRASLAVTETFSRLQKLTLPWRAFYLARPGLMTKLLAIVAFFSIGVV